MLVLDLDFDVLVSPTAEADQPGDRPTDADHVAAAPAPMRRWLGAVFGLSTETPIAGECVTEHRDVIGLWHRWIDRGEVAPPFDLIHLQSHSDLSYGSHRRNEPAIEELLARPTRERLGMVLDRPEMVTSGNCVLLAMACGWIRRLVHVHRDDAGSAARIFLREYGRPREGRRLLHHLPAGAAGDEEEQLRIRLGGREGGFEPPVPCRVVKLSQLASSDALPAWARRSPDRVVFVKSPAVTPPKADGLMKVASEYLATEKS